MPIGVCRLCLQTGQLQNSHLLPKALSKLLTTLAKASAASNANPIAITPAVALQTSRQVCDYLLCAACEDLLSKGGEKWVVGNCWRSDEKFSLRSSLEKTTPLDIDEKRGVKLYAGGGVTGVDCPKLLHFAAGVFWRAAAHRWPSQITGTSLKQLDLGPYEDLLRRFVLFESSWPNDVVLYVSVNSELRPGANET